MVEISFPFMFDGQFQFIFGESDLKNENIAVFPRHRGGLRAQISQQSFTRAIMMNILLN